jgi:sugar phosphate isomerase/epimerase
MREMSDNTMIERLHHYIRPGILHFMAFPVMNGDGPILESLMAILEDCFFEVVEISWIKDPKTRAQAKHLLMLSGIQVKYGAQPRLLTQRLNLNSLDCTNRKRAVAEMYASIDEAVELGASDFSLMSGPYEGAKNKAANFDALELSLNDICSYAADRGMEVALEVFDRDIDKKCLIGPAADAKEIAERVKAKHRNFGLIVDLSHIPLLGETPTDALRPVADHLARVHIGNCYCDRPDDPAYGDKHPRFGYPGSANDVPEIVAFLKELFHTGYLKPDGSERRAVSFEMKPAGDEPVGVMIAGAKRKLLEAWNQLTPQLSSSHDSSR